MGAKRQNGKYPEEVHPFQTAQVMYDDKFMLMQQCIRDARQLHRMVTHFEYSNPEYGNKTEFGSWENYEKAVLELASTLFEERSRNPISQETFKTLMLAGSSATQTLADISMYHEEVLGLVENINKMTLEQKELEKSIDAQRHVLAEIKSRDFLVSTIGETNTNLLENTGFINLVGTNGAKYKLTKDGYIYKTVIKKRFLWGSKEKQVGFGIIQNRGGLPMNDAIATIYMHISRDSDRFDRDKACGAITIRGVNNG